MLYLFIKIFVILLIVGVVMYLFNTLVTMDSRFKQAINILVGLCVFLWLIFGTGLIEWAANL